MAPRAFLLIALAGATIVVGAARAGSDAGSVPPRELEQEPWSWLADYDLSANAGERTPLILRWTPPADCAPVYRIAIEERMPDELARFHNREPERSESYLTLDAKANADADAGRDARGRPVHRLKARLHSEDAGVKPYGSRQPIALSLERDVYVSAIGMGPSAPDAACRNRSWDPIEDALALGWPWLSDARVTLGDSWSGARVEGRCNETACLTEDGMAGARAHEFTCATPSWRETLVGSFELGGERFAAVRGQWSDRGDVDTSRLGVETERRALISTAHGRLAWAAIRVQHRWSGVQRDILIESVDECPGSLRAAGWPAPAAISQAAARTLEATRAPTR